MFDQETMEATETLADMLEESEAEEEAPFVDPRRVPVRFSNLKAVSASLAHYVQALQTDREDTLSLRLGSVGHALMLGTPGVVVYAGNRTRSRPNAKGPTKFERFAAEHPGKLIASPREHATASGMVEAILRNNDAVRVLLKDTTRERQFEWELYGRPATSRPDAFGPDHHAELKTTRSANPKWFKFDAKKLLYFAQAAMYGQGLAQAGLSTAKDAYLVAVESVKPYVVSVFKWTDATLAEGDKCIALWMNRLNSSLESNPAHEPFDPASWPPYVQAIADLDLDFFDD